jgi:tetratricopeptide (TPR) repeat protein
MVSLSGIIVIAARGIARSRRTEFAASIKSAEGAARVSQTNEVLRPTQKSVQAIRSRAALASQWLGQAGSLARRAAPSPGRLRSWTRAVGERTRSAGQWVRTRFRRQGVESPEEPDIDALLAPIERPAITTRVVDTAPAREVKPVLGQPLAALRRNHAPKKKISPLQRAQAALQDKDYQHAEDILVDYIVHHTKDAKAYMLLGNVAMAKANWSEGVEIFEQVVALRPHEPGAQAGLGIAAYNLGRYGRALQALQRAHEEDPTDLTVLTDLLAIAKKMDNPALQRSIQAKLREITPALQSEARPTGRPAAAEVGQ